MVKKQSKVEAMIAEYKSEHGDREESELKERVFDVMERLNDAEASLRSANLQVKLAKETVSKCKEELKELK